MANRIRPSAMVTARGRVLASAIAMASLLVVLLVPTPGVDAAKKKNGIIFNIKTSQGITGRITYLKYYEGEGRNFAQLEIAVLMTCTGGFGSYTERSNVILQGHTKGNTFSVDSQPQNTPTDQFRQSARVKFKPKGRRGGLPRWKKTTGTVSSSRSINDPFVRVSCDSGPVSFTTTSSRGERFGPRPSIIVVISPV